jgi:hypothetical protein
MNRVEAIAPSLLVALMLGGCPPVNTDPESTLSEQAYNRITQGVELKEGESALLTRIRHQGTLYEQQLVYVAGVSSTGEKFVTVDLSSSPFFDMDGQMNVQYELVDIGLDQDLETRQRAQVGAENSLGIKCLTDEAALETFNGCLDYLLDTTNPLH